MSELCKCGNPGVLHVKGEGSCKCQRRESANPCPRCAEMAAALETTENVIHDAMKAASVNNLNTAGSLLSAYQLYGRDYAAIAPLLAEIERLRGALEVQECNCEIRSLWICPQCRAGLVPVSSEQGWPVGTGPGWNAFYCQHCEGVPGVGNSRKYWRESELPREVKRQCSRCAALAEKGISL